MSKNKPNTPAPSSVKKGKKEPGLSTQRYLQMAEIHDDTLVLKSGGLRSVLEVDSINFHLKSEAEQTAILQGYQRFLNALDFPVQIQIRSRKLDIDNYLEDLRGRMKTLTNPLLQNQMGEYIEYITKLVEYSDIMEKKFYVVVPLDPPRAQKKGILADFLQYIKPDDTVLEVLKRKREFHDLKKKLESRVSTVTSALGNLGLTVRPLPTNEILELFYQAYNPELSRRQKLEHPEQFATEPSQSFPSEEETKD